MLISQKRSLIFISLAMIIYGILYKFHRLDTANYAYYVCSQVMNESEGYLIEWIEYQLNVVGFKNICLINVGEQFNPILRDRYSIGVIEKDDRKQDFNLCLKCFEQPMKSTDLIFVQDIDEFLNVRQADIIQKNYEHYDKFHFQEIRFGYVYEWDQEMINRSLLETNVYRKPHADLGEDTSQRLRDLHNCQIQDGWYSCDEGQGKEMIKVGKIHRLSAHFHQSNRNDNRTIETFYADMKSIRLHHYIMRTRENGIQKGMQWKKIPSRMGVINSNSYFKLIFDNTIKDSKRLL